MTTDGSSEAEDESEATYDIETYRHAIKEARRTHDQQLDAFNDVGEKGWRVVRLNGIFSAIYIAGIANALNGVGFGPWAKACIVVGFVCIGVSTATAMFGQRHRTVKLGLSPTAFERVREHEPPENIFLYYTLKDYESSIKDVNAKTEENGNAITISKVAFALGVGFITIGTLLPFIL